MYAEAIVFSKNPRGTPLASKCSVLDHRILFVILSCYKRTMNTLILLTCFALLMYLYSIKEMTYLVLQKILQFRIFTRDLVVPHAAKNNRLQWSAFSFLLHLPCFLLSSYSGFICICTLINETRSINLMNNKFLIPHNCMCILEWFINMQLSILSFNHNGINLHMHYQLKKK